MLFPLVLCSFDEKQPVDLSYALSPLLWPILRVLLSIWIHSDFVLSKRVAELHLCGFRLPFAQIGALCNGRCSRSCWYAVERRAFLRVRGFLHGMCWKSNTPSPCISIGHSDILSNRSSSSLYLSLDLLSFFSLLSFFLCAEFHSFLLHPIEEIEGSIYSTMRAELWKVIDEYVGSNLTFYLPSIYHSMVLWFYIILSFSCFLLVRLSVLRLFVIRDA